MSVVQCKDELLGQAKMNNLRASILRLEQNTGQKNIEMRRTFNALVGGGRRRLVAETYTAPKDDVHFFAAVDPNHMYGSSVTLKNGKKFFTQFNLCSTLVIRVPNFDQLLKQKNRAKHIGYKPKYLAKFGKSLKRVKHSKRRWVNMKKSHLKSGQLPELAWKNPKPLHKSEAQQITYTASYPAGLIDLAQATEQRTGRPWRFGKNRHNKRGTFPVIETCGVILMDKRARILTFPNFKFASYYSVPGGSVDWPHDAPPNDLQKQAAFVAHECLRELREESGISIKLEETPPLNIVANKKWRIRSTIAEKQASQRPKSLHADALYALSLTRRHIDENDLVRLIRANGGEIRLVFDYTQNGARMQLPFVFSPREDIIQNEMHRLNKLLEERVTHLQIGERKVQRTVLQEYI